MNKKKYIQTGDDYLFDETLDYVDDSLDIDEYMNDPRFDDNDHEYLQEIYENGVQSEDVQFIPTDRYFKRFRKNRQLY